MYFTRHSFRFSPQEPKSTTVLDNKTRIMQIGQVPSLLEASQCVSNTVITFNAQRYIFLLLYKTDFASFHFFTLFNTEPLHVCETNAGTDLRPQRNNHTFLMHLLYIPLICSLLCLFYITVVREAECHALSTSLFPEGEEPGLRNLSHDGGEMLLAVWRGGLTVSVRTVTAINHKLTLGKQKRSFNWLETLTVMRWGNVEE